MSLTNNQMDQEEQFYKSLDYIQDIIKRQATNSFKIKGWTVALVVIALLFRSEGLQFVMAYIPLFGFWYLDGYYLHLERRYRALYARRILKPPTETWEIFSLKADKTLAKSPSKLMFSRSIVWFYGIIFALLTAFVLFAVLFPMQFTPPQSP